MLNSYYRLILAFVIGITCITGAKPGSAAPEITVWLHPDTLPVARETAQAFTILGYTRGEQIVDVTSVEIKVPANWQVWSLNEAPPPMENTAPQTLHYSCTQRPTKDTAGSTDHSPAMAAIYLYLVVRPSAQAEKGTLEVRWLQGQKLLDQCQTTLDPLSLRWKIQPMPESSQGVGMWVDGPLTSNAATMAEIYRGLARAGVNYLIISRPEVLYVPEKEVLHQLGIKVFINQWWDFNAYLPDAPPEEAFATLKDGSIDRTRWSPTYMAEGGPAFIKQVEKVADKLQQMGGVYGLMLDWEPGRKAMDADYSEHSRQLFEKYLGRKVLSWPADVLPDGKDSAAWITFRVAQSDAYVKWFTTILHQRAPEIHLAVSTAGNTGKPDDRNRVLAATDITQISRVADSIHPQIYTWPSKALMRIPVFMEHLELGKTTIAGAHAPVYPAVGSGGGKLTLSDPGYLRTQILYWWFNGADGYEVWSYLYGVDGNYLALANEMAHLFQEAGERPQGSAAQNNTLIAQPSNSLKILQRKSADGKTVWVGLFNLSNKPIVVPLKTQAGWRLSDTQQTTVTIAPWNTYVVKCQ